MPVFLYQWILVRAKDSVVGYLPAEPISYQGAQERTLASLRPEARAIARCRLCGVLPMSDHVCQFMGSLVSAPWDEFSSLHPDYFGR